MEVLHHYAPMFNPISSSSNGSNFSPKEALKKNKNYTQKFLFPSVRHFLLHEPLIHMGRYTEVWLEGWIDR